MDPDPTDGRRRLPRRSPEFGKTAAAASNGDGAVAPVALRLGRTHGEARRDEGTPVVVAAFGVGGDGVRGRAAELRRRWQDPTAVAWGERESRGLAFYMREEAERSLEEGQRRGGVRGAHGGAAVEFFLQTNENNKIQHGI